MKGTLHKTESGWHIINIQATLHGPLLQSLPLLDNGYVNGLGLYDSNKGVEVEFEIVDYSQKCKECGERVERGRNCKEGCFMKPGNFIATEKFQYAKISL